MVSVTAEKTGGLSHWQDQRESHQLGLAGFGRESDPELGDIVNVEVDPVEAVADVHLQ